MAIVRGSSTRSGIGSRTAIRADGAPGVRHVRARSQVKPVGRVLRARVLEETPGAVPGCCGLVPGDVLRSIEDTHALLHKHMASLFSLQEFLGSCSPSVPILERVCKKERHLDHARKRAGQEISRCAISGETQRANFSPSQSPTAKLESRNADRIPFSAS
jgi:hypothetical protein